MSTTYGPLTVYSPNGDGGVSGSATWSTQFSKDDESTTAGLGVHAYVGFNTFTVTITNGLITGFSLYAYSGAETKGTAPNPTYDAGSYTVTLNGTPIFGPNTSAPLASTLVSYSDINGISPCKIIIAGSLTAHVYSQSVSPSFSVTYDLYVQTANLVFSEYDSQIGNSPSTYNFKMLFLEPPSVSNHGKLIAVKDKSFQAGTMFTLIYPPQGIQIEGNAIPGSSAAAGLAVNGQCNTYIIDNVSSIYRIANIYPSHNQIALPTINPSGLTPVLASASVADIFSTDSTPGRTTVNNLVELPAVSNPTGIGSLKIIVYGGRTSAKYTGNVLAIQEPSGGNFIDNTYGTTTKPYLQTDASTNANEKNTGIVFISNENQWFVLGYYETSPWTWSTATPGSQTYIMPSNTFQYNNIVSASPYVIALPALQSLSLVKNLNTSSTVEFFRIQTSGTSVFNEAGTVVNYTGNPTNSTTWILTYATGGGNFKNYIVLSYTPN